MSAARQLCLKVQTAVQVAGWRLLAESLGNLEITIPWSCYAKNGQQRAGFDWSFTACCGWPGSLGQ
jgi:hypothetical protein